MKPINRYILLHTLCFMWFFEPAQNIDALERAFKTAAHDTTKLRLLYQLSNECEERDIVKYAQQGIDLADNMLKASQDQTSVYKNTVLKYKAMCIGNIGFAWQNQSDYKKAINYYGTSLKIQQEINEKQDIAMTYNNLAVSWQSLGDLDKALNYYEKSIKIQDEIGDKAGKATSLGNLGVIYHDQGNSAKALECYFSSLKIEEELEEKNGMSVSLNCIGGVYDNLGDIQKAIYYFSKSIKVSEESGNKESLAQALGNIGAIYLKQNDVSKAMEFFLKSLKINTEIGRKEGISTDLNNIGASYSYLGNTEKALEYYIKSLQIEEEIGNQRDIYHSLNNIGNIYEKQSNYSKALDCYLKSLELTKNLGDRKGIALVLGNLSSLYFRLANSNGPETTMPLSKKNKCALAYAYADSSLRISKALGFPYNIARAEALLSKIDSAQGNFSGAFEHLKQFVIYRDSIANEGTRRASVKSQLKYEFDKKEAVIKEQQEKERAIAKEKNRFQQIIIFSVIFGLLLVIVFAAFIFRTLKITRHQKTIIEEKQKEILDSIYYAKRIQTSLLPTEKYIARQMARGGEEPGD